MWIFLYNKVRQLPFNNPLLAARVLICEKEAIVHKEICVQECSKQRTVCNMVGGNATDSVHNLKSKQGYGIANEPADFPSMVWQDVLCLYWEALDRKSINSEELV